MLISCTGETSKESNIKWQDVAFIDIKLIDQLARNYAILQMPELDGTEIKLVQVNAMYQPKVNKPDLSVTFLHENSLKEFEQNKTLKNLEANYQTTSVMEFVKVHFDESGEPIELSIQEVLLQGGEKEFRDTYDSF